jgi:hypothetical protein
VKRTHAWAGLGIAAAVLASTMTGIVPAQAAGNTLVVNAAAPYKPVTYVGSGGLYALATASNPSVALLKPLRLRQHTQPPPGVQQLGNGATVPTGDALVVAPAAIANGAQQYVRMPDIYPNFPYQWVSWADWDAKVDKMVQDRLAANGTTNINGWEVWNEPDWTWNTSAAGSFNAGWTRTVNRIRTLDTITPVVGPSYAIYNSAAMRAFMTNARDTGTLPGVVTWHELDDFSWNRIDENVADYRQIEQDLGISPRPISINEYGSPNQVDTPSVAAHYIAQFERTGVNDAERAYWYESGTVGGLVWNNQPTGSYWLYKWYGEMAGNMVTVTPSGDWDGAASYDSTRRIVNVIFGGDYGNNSVRVDGISSFGSSAQVTVNHTPNTGRHGTAAAPTQVLSQTLPIVNGSVTVPLTNTDYLGAYQLIVTPAGGPLTSYQQRYEAENATVVNAQRRSSGSASNGGYVGGIDGSANARNQSFVDFLVLVPNAGAYTLTIRYANGTGATSTHGLAYNGGGWQTVSYPPTGAWGNPTGSVSQQVTLNAGYNMIRLAKGSPYFGGGTGYAELDYIQLTQ